MTTERERLHQALSVAADWCLENSIEHTTSCYEQDVYPGNYSGGRFWVCPAGCPVSGAQKRFLAAVKREPPP